MKIKQAENGVTYYLNVESHYDNKADAKGAADAVIFEMCQFKGDSVNDYEVDALITSSVEDARTFSESILKLRDEIESKDIDK